MALIDWFTGEDSERDQAILDETDRRLAQLNQERADRLRQQGKDREAEAYLAETQANLNRGKVNDVAGQVDDAFYQGLNEGAANIRGSIGSTLGAALQAPFKLLPWWVILGAGIAAFVYFGGLRLIKRPA